MQHAMRLFEVFRPFQFGRATTYATRGPLDVLSDPAYLLHYWSMRTTTGGTTVPALSTTLSDSTNLAHYWSLRI